MNNRELFEMLFDVVFEYDPEFIEAGRKTDAMVSEFIEGNIFEVTQDEEEAISDAFMNILTEARHDSYMIGAKHAFKLIFGLLSN